MKKAILVVSFGTAYKSTREETIEACENKIKEEFSEYDFYRAYTSNKIIQKIKISENIDIYNPKQSLDKLYEDGYEEVIIQTLHIIAGKEFNKLKKQFENYKSKFKKLALGKPLITGDNDYKEILEALKIQISKINKNEAMIFMGHGTSNDENKVYSYMEDILRDDGINAYVVTIKDYLKLNKIITTLKKDSINVVYLMPFMLVAGVHAIKDMAGDNENSWESILKKHGFEVKIYMQGLGANIKIQEKFINHAKNCYIG